MYARTRAVNTAASFPFQKNSLAGWEALAPCLHLRTGGGGGREGGQLTNQMHGLNGRQGEKEETDKRRKGERCKSQGLHSELLLELRGTQKRLIRTTLMSVQTFKRRALGFSRRLAPFNKDGLFKLRFFFFVRLFTQQTIQTTSWFEDFILQHSVKAQNSLKESISSAFFQVQLSE